LESDYNIDELQDVVEIPHGNSTNKPQALKRPLSRRTSSCAKVNNLPQTFFHKLEYNFSCRSFFPIIHGSFVGVDFLAFAFKGKMLIVAPMIF
jgi:hypothetical protein